MKTIISAFLTVLATSSLFSQPVLRGDSIHTGLTFNMYSLSNLNTSNLMSYGANVTWDISAATATLAGIAEFLPMSATPYGAQYPAANFAIKFTVNGSVSYSLFKLTSTAFEEVGNNVSATGGIPFLNFRTALVFPYTYNLTNTDTYQKTGQANKTIIHKYDAYGSIVTSIGTYSNVIRDLTVDNGDTAVNIWRTSPTIPIFTANNNGFTLWKLTSPTTALYEVENDKSFDLFPNPAANTITVLNKEPLSKIEVYNASGQLMLISTQSVIDLSEITQGIYIIKAYTQSGSTCKKFIKQ